MEFFNLKQPPGANKYPQYTTVYSKYTAVYSRVYGRILRYWSLEHTAVYPKSPKWGIFKHNIDHHNWQTRGIPQPTYACIVHYTFVPTCTCHIPLSPKTPFFTRILPGIPGMPRYAHHMDGCCSPGCTAACGGGCGVAPAPMAPAAVVGGAAGGGYPQPTGCMGKWVTLKYPCSSSNTKRKMQSQKNRNHQKKRTKRNKSLCLSMHFKLEAHLKCVVIARYFQLYIAISRVPALEDNSIARAIVVIARTQ